MSLNYYIADVFTHQIFAGAQIAVFPQADKLSDEQMLQIAGEMNLSETVFVSNPQSSATHWKMRIFSPLGEIDFAGHPIIATAFVLGSCGEIELTETITRLTFSQNIGDIEVNVSANDGKPTFVQFTRKVSSVIDRFTPSDNELAELLSITVAEIDHNK